MKLYIAIKETQSTNSTPLDHQNELLRINQYYFVGQISNTLAYTYVLVLASHK